MVAISRAEYNRLRAAAKELVDLHNFHRARTDLVADEGALIPAICVKEELPNGESALRAYRNLRGLTQAELAESAGVKRVTVTAIETGRRRGSVATLRALANALEVTLDDLVE